MKETQKSYTNPVAFVYLQKDHDEKNKCLITQDQLILIFKGRSTKIELNSLLTIKIAHKLFLLPIIFGGAFGPFFFISLITDFLHPVASLTGFLLSVFALYFGFTGKYSYRLETHNDVHEIFLNSISDNLRVFTSFVNDIISVDNKDEILTFYMPITKQMRDDLNEKNQILFDENGVFSETSRDYHQKKRTNKLSHSAYLKVHYKTPNIQIRFEKDRSGNLKPKIFGSIKVDDNMLDEINSD